MFCPKCGNSLPDDAAFCGACGTQLASATPVQKPKVQVKKSWIAIGAAVLVVALVVVLCVTLIGGNSAKGVLEKYLDGGVGYGWHISDLKIYDTPRELREFTGLRQTKFGAEPGPITRPPQSWCYVEVT